MAKSTRQHVFEGMELLPAALVPFVEKRLETSHPGHWQLQVLEKLPSLRPNSSGAVAWDQAALFNAMDRFWSEAFKAVLGRAVRLLAGGLDRDLPRVDAHGDGALRGVRARDRSALKIDFREIARRRVPGDDRIAEIQRAAADENAAAARRRIF